MDLEALLPALKLTGEGRGRLAMDKKTYVFGYEAVLKENSDWVLAISVPLQGEEVLILKDLRSKKSPDGGDRNFETRINDELRHRSGDQAVTGESFLEEFRGMLRFVLREKLQLTATCKRIQEALECIFEEEVYRVSSTNNEIIIRRQIDEKHYVEMTGQNLTGPIFTRNNFFLFAGAADAGKRQPVVSLELFWKE
ncbi:MAG TPA: hypothetical protein VNJ01_03005 [Bacteriovoracaceae bacterium]|nr:hypothetical protein [Bacteriovoracaceae bacterium]